MEQNDWYQRYQAQPNMNTGKKKARGVRASTLVICTLCAALAGGLFGSVYAKRYVDSSLANMTLSASVAQAAAAPSTTAGGNTASAVPAASTPASEAALQAEGTTAYSKAQIIELCAPAVVGIDTTYSYAGYWGSQTGEGSGSGIVLSSDGYIVTCLHVVDGADTIKVVLNDDSEHTATFVGGDARNDLAVIKIEADGLTPVTLGDSDMLTVGEDAVAIGNPLGELRGTATSGIISALGREVSIENTDMTLIQTDAAISPGNSGGGLFNSSGCLIGIVNAKASSSNSEGLGFAIPVNSVKQIISDLMDHGYVRGRAYLGVYTQNVTLQSGQNGWGDSSFFGFSFGSGGTACVQVAQLVEGAAAQKAGIEVGDLILKVDEREISSNETLSAAINAYNAGDTATITLQRNGQEQTVTVTFGEYQPAN